MMIQVQYADLFRDTPLREATLDFTSPPAGAAAQLPPAHDDGGGSPPRRGSGLGAARKPFRRSGMEYGTGTGTAALAKARDAALRRAASRPYRVSPAVDAFRRQRGEV